MGFNKKDQRAALLATLISFGIVGAGSALYNTIAGNPAEKSKPKIVDYKGPDYQKLIQTNSRSENKNYNPQNSNNNSQGLPLTLFPKSDRSKNLENLLSQTEPVNQKRKPQSNEPPVKEKDYKISESGIELIERSEGLRLKPYKDVAGHETIGYGHLIKSGENFRGGISKSEAERLLHQDISWAEKAVNKDVKVPLTQGQYDALVDFTYNLGTGALRSSTLLKELNSGDYKDAANQFPRWIHAGGKILPGLVKRREAEKEMFLGK